MSDRFKPIFLKPKKERALQNRHPWVFSGAIAKIDESVKIGDEVCLFDADGRALALGYWCGDTGLVIRLVSFDPKEKLDATFFYHRFFGAKNLRQKLNLPREGTTGFRLIHGEGDGLSGLICDIFADTASIQLSNPGLRPYITLLCQFLKEQFGIKNIYFADSGHKSAEWILGQTEMATFLENGHTFIADVGFGQKTGHFLDQRVNRELVKFHASKRRVLDTFCYSGGFSIYALSGGASSVISVDISSSATSLCEKNVRLNYHQENQLTEIGDCFLYLRAIKKHDFDLIILDPPAFAKTSQTVIKASRGYKDINLLAMKALAPSGLIFTFSCSQHVSMELFKKIIFAAAKDSEREVKIINELSQAPDHPVSVFCPQSAYLKGLLLYVS